MVVGPQPNVDVQIGLAAGPLDTAPAWTSCGATVVSIKTQRGREYEQDEAQVGTATAVLDGSSGKFTPGNSAAAGLDTDRPVRIQVTPPSPYDGTTYTVHRGALDSAPTTDIAGFDTVTATINSQDALQYLGQALLRSAYDQEVLKAAPTVYWPLDEAQGATTFGSPVPGVPTLSPQFLVGQQYAETTPAGTPGIYAGQYAAGGNPLLAADDATCVDFAPETGYVGAAPDLPVGVDGYLLQSTAPTPLLPNAQWTISFVFAAAPVSGPLPVVLYETGTGAVFAVAPGTDAQSGVPAGTDMLIYPATSGGVATTDFAIFQQSPVWTDLGVHHIAFTCDSSGTFTRYIDGVASPGAGNAGNTPRAISTSAGITIGGGKINGGTGSGFFAGRIGKVAIFPTALTAAQISAQYAAMNGFSGELSGARQSRILDYAGFPSSPRSIDRGEGICGPLISAGSYALDLTQTLQATEMGASFVNGAGNFCFYDRHRTRNTTSRQTLTGGSLTGPEADLQLDYDRRHILNTVQAQRTNGAQLTVTNATSVARRGTYSDSLTFDLASDSDVMQAATWLGLIYANPRTRVRQVSIDPLTNPALWPFALTVEIFDRITLAGLPSYAPATSLDFIVVQVQHAATQGPKGKWLTTLQLTPIELFSTLRIDASPSAFTKLDAGLKIPY